MRAEHIFPHPWYVFRYLENHQRLVPSSSCPDLGLKTKPLLLGAFPDPGVVKDSHNFYPAPGMVGSVVIKSSMSVLRHYLQFAAGPLTLAVTNAHKVDRLTQATSCIMHRERLLHAPRQNLVQQVGSDLRDQIIDF